MKGKGSLGKVAGKDVEDRRTATKFKTCALPNGEGRLSACRRLVLHFFISPQFISPSVGIFLLTATN